MSDDSSSPPVGAIPMRDAYSRFTPTDLKAEYERAILACEESPELSPFIWLALNSETAGPYFDEQRNASKAIEDRERCVQNIDQAFRDSLIAGRLVAYAQAEFTFGQWQEIPGATWKALTISDVHSGHVIGEDFDVKNVPIVALSSGGPALPNTGSPGRPTPMPIVLDEHARRRASRTIMPSAAKESIALLAWYQATYPNGYPLKAATIEQALGPIYTRAKAGLTGTQGKN